MQRITFSVFKKMNNVQSCCFLQICSSVFNFKSWKLMKAETILIKGSL